MGLSVAWAEGCPTADTSSSRPGAGPGSPEAIIGVQRPLLPLTPLARVVQPVRGDHHEDEVRVVVILLLPEAPQVSTAMVVLTVHACRGKEGDSRLSEEGGMEAAFSSHPLTAGKRDSQSARKASSKVQLRMLQEGET